VRARARAKERERERENERRNTLGQSGERRTSRARHTEIDITCLHRTWRGKSGHQRKTDVHLIRGREGGGGKGFPPSFLKGTIGGTISSPALETPERLARSRSDIRAGRRSGPEAAGGVLLISAFFRLDFLHNHEMIN